MKIKRIVTAAAAFLFLIPWNVLSAAAVDSSQVNEKLTDGTFDYELVNGSYTIVGCESTAVFTEIPELRNGYAITAIADNAFANCTMIKELTIPDTITSIGHMAFAGCTSLTKITLPSKIKELPQGIFMGCTKLESIDIPDAVNTIDSYAFYNCSMLTDVKLPGELSTIKPMAFAECSSVESFDASSCASYVFEDGILYNSSKTNISRASAKLTGDVYIRDGVTTIDAGAFSVCAGIENLFIPSSVEYIGDDAFGYCVSLKKVDFSEGLTTISDVAFKNCASLQTLELPTTLNKIGEGAFYKCTSLERVMIPEGTVSVGTGAFTDCDSLKQVSIPQSVTDIGENAFGFNLNESGEYVVKDGFSLSVYSDSAGMKYAKSNKIDYSAVDKNLKGIVFAVIAIGLILTVVVFAAVLMARSRKSASPAVKKADKLAKEKEEEESYGSILDDEEAEK